jgi:cobalt-zinc-cadmium efflux system protein
MLMHVHTGGEHGHDHAIHDHRDVRPLRIAIALTSTVLVVQVIGGIISNSLALLSDAGHVFVDLASLLIAFFGLRLAARAREKHDIRYTFGLRRLEILAALTNGFLLLGICIYIVIEAVKRLSDPQDVHAESMLAIAIIGFIANSVSALYLHKSEHITTRSAYLHVITDLLSSVGVIVAAVMLSFTDWLWLDPAISILIALLITRGAVRVIREASIILMESAPSTINVRMVKEALAELPGVLDVHDVHVWQLGQHDVNATVHVVTSQPNDEMVNTVRGLLREQFGIAHSTVQIERANMDDDCGTTPPMAEQA